MVERELADDAQSGHGLVATRTAQPLHDPGHRPEVGFARVVTDRATFAYLANVFVDDKLSGLGLGTG